MDINDFVSKDNKITIIKGKIHLCKTINIIDYIKHHKNIYSIDGLNGFDIYEICGDIAYDDLKVDYYDHSKRTGYFIIK